MPVWVTTVNIFPPRPPDFSKLVPSRKTNPVKSGGAEDQICPIFVEAENF
jgi:hypothetical protein